MNNTHSHQQRTHTVDPATQSQFVTLAAVICTVSSSGDCPAAAPLQRLQVWVAQTNTWTQHHNPPLPPARELAADV